TDLPAIVEPIYRRDTNGKLAPHRMMWPAYWGVRENGPEKETIRPLAPSEVEASAGDLLYPERAVVRILAALEKIPDRPGPPVLVLGGTVYEPNLDGGLTVKSAAANGPASAGYYFASAENGETTPFIPDFDPANAAATAEPEAAIQTVLEALRETKAAPGEPAFLYKGFLYRLTGGALDKSERKDAAAAGAEWMWAKGDSPQPMLSDFEKNAVMSLTGTDLRLTESQVARILEVLARDGRKNPVYISGGKLFRLDKKGRLEAVNDEAAEPVAWPLAHEVRPARQSLGWNGCTDCHSATSDFFFAKVNGRGPLQTKKIASHTNATYMGVNNVYHRLFGLSYLGRPYFKIVLAAAAFVIGIVLLAALVLAVGRMSGLIEKRK
ncbi:MAG: hypothetical protein NTW38_05570, partial [Candidatus Aminicenantes bacterium]|nr:hypothetical protein [Candidatus Aminicenantes bacterium]